MRVRLKGLNHVRKRLADGTLRTYYYAWKSGPRLSGEPGSPEFIASYNAAITGSRRLPKRDLQSLIDEYLDSNAFTALKPKTQRTYLYQIDKRIRPEFHDMAISALSERGTRREILDWRQRIGKTAPRQADLAFRTLARIISWALDREIISLNPCLNAGKLYAGTRRDIVWTPEQEAAFRASAPKHLCLALDLALWTGQRQGDLLELQWSSYDGEFIRLKQSKTGKRVIIPVARNPKVALDARKAELVRSGKRAENFQLETILTTMSGDAWTEDGFRGTWAKARDEAKIENVRFNDLRGTAVTRLAVAGCSVPEIASITGHSLKDAEAICADGAAGPCVTTIRPSAPISVWAMARPHARRALTNRLTSACLNRVDDLLIQ